MRKGDGRKKYNLNVMKKNNLKIVLLVIGIIGMCLSVVGTIVEGGSLAQKILFLIGASCLISTAIYNSQKMFIALQGVILVGAVLGFFQDISNEWKYVIMGGASVLAVGELIRKKYFNKDPWGIIGSAGLFCIALGFAINASQNPFIFNALLLSGGVFVAIYSAIGFFYYRVRISILWLILNVVFAVNPFIELINL